MCECVEWNFLMHYVRTIRLFKHAIRLSNFYFGTLTPFKFNILPLTVSSTLLPLCTTGSPVPPRKSLICTPSGKMTKGASPLGGFSCCPTSRNWASTVPAAWALGGINKGIVVVVVVAMAIPKVERRNRREDEWRCSRVVVWKGGSESPWMVWHVRRASRLRE